MSELIKLLKAEMVYTDAQQHCERCKWSSDKDVEIGLVCEFNRVIHMKVQATGNCKHFLARNISK